MFEKAIVQNKIYDLLEKLNAPIFWYESPHFEKLYSKLEILFCSIIEEFDLVLETALNYFIDFYLGTTDANYFSKPDRRIAHQAFDLFSSRYAQGINIFEVCVTLNVSRRTLELSYKKIFGITPGKHLRMIRLCSIRKTLIESTDTSRISAILQNNNIKHWGHFGRSYKKMFKEKMIETIKRRFIDSPCECAKCQK